MGASRQHHLVLLLAALLAGMLLALTQVRAVAAPADRIWPIGPVLDQGSTPMCVGYAWIGYLHAGPQPLWPPFSAAQLYAAAKHRDGAPDKPGTWLWAAEWVLRDTGYLTEVYYTHSLTDSLAYLARTGPVLVDAPWFGTTRHAYLLYGVDAARTRVWLQNSWGRDWGQGGTAIWSIEVLLAKKDVWYAWPRKPLLGPAWWRVVNGWAD